MMTDAPPSRPESAAPRKFLFDLAFDDDAALPASAKDKPKPIYTQDDLDAARESARMQGFSEGQKAAQDEATRQTQRLVAQIGQKVDSVLQLAHADGLRYLAQMQEIALVITRKILPRYAEKHGLDEIEGIVTKITADMSREPRLVIRVAESAFEEASALINGITAGQAYPGKVVILGDAALGPSDVRIEWAEGGIERDLKSLWQDIDRVIGDGLAAETAAAIDVTQSQTPSSAGEPT